MKIVRGLLGNEIQEIPLNMGLDFYDVNIGNDMGTVIPTMAGAGIEVVNDVIPFPEEIDEAEEGMRVYAIEVRYNTEDPPDIVSNATHHSHLYEYLYMYIGFFEFDEIEASNNYTTDLLEEIEESLGKLKIGVTTEQIVDVAGTAIVRAVRDAQFHDAIIFDGGFEFPLNPSIKFIRTNPSGLDILSFNTVEDLITLRIWYKKVRRSRGLFDRILALFRQNIDA